MTAAADVPTAGSLTSDQLDAILRQSAPGGRQLTVDDFLSRLPENYRRGYTLMYRSQSSQIGTPQNPRQIFYGSDAKTMISVSSNPNDPNYNNIEMISWDEKQGAFVMRQISFPRKPGRLADVETNPSECTSCHNNPPRPNWAPHNTWPGAYCSTGRYYRDATCAERFGGAKAYRDYEATRAQGVRSKYLHCPHQGSSARRYSAREARIQTPILSRKIIKSCPNGVGFDPNSKLSELASELNFKKILREPRSQQGGLQ